jgi:hypothetical protein
MAAVPSADPDPTGQSDWPIEVSASYLGCTADPHQRPTVSDPRCLENDKPPPLPVGNYEARLYQSTHLVADPDPIMITVTP